MPEDTSTRTEQEEQETAAPGIVHDDIMQRLLEYQRQLREGVAAERATGAREEPSPEDTAGGPVTATKTESVEVVDITEAEAELEAKTEPEAGAEIGPETEIGRETEIGPEGKTGPKAKTEPQTTEQEIERLEVVAEIPVEAETSASGQEKRPVEISAREARSTVPSDLAGRVAELEEALDRVAAMVSELRARFQDMAISADERLAVIEETISEIGSPHRN